MIKFFRHIRKQLLTENKFSRYLLYAIGEIVLVMVGILLALQVNNWNEVRKLAKERITILQNLREDLTNDIENYQYSFLRLEDRQKVAENVILLFDTIPKTIDSAKTARDLLVLGFIEDHNPNFSTYNEVLSSGKLGLINSKKIKLALANYKSTVDNFHIIGSNWNEDIKDYERIVSGYFKGTIYQQFLPMDRTDVSQNQHLRFDLAAMSKNSDFISRIRHIAYFTRMEINLKKYSIIPVCESIIKEINTVLASEKLEILELEN
jgi:type II secretory pathway pseudopilin PulG